MTIHSLIQSIPFIRLVGDDMQEVSSLCFDSREVGPSSLFVAQRGTQTDGHSYIPNAVAQGACCIVLETMPEEISDKVCYIQVENASAALARLADAFYGHPSTQLKLVGITGTNGKTTTVTLLYRLFSFMGHVCGLLSTIENRIAGKVIPSTHTTPDAVHIHALLREMVDAGCEYCFMEVSSHSIVQHRIDALHFEGGIFSNITHDHLDYHKTFQEYIRAKKCFFDHLPKTAFALTNADDANGAVMLQNTSAQCHSYGLKSGNVDFKARILEYHMDGMLLEMDGTEVWTRLTGDFNAYNLLAIYGVARLLGKDKDEVLRNLSAQEAAEGRFACISGNHHVTAVVDYAHTPDALDNVLNTIRKIRCADQRILTVVGCGGNRDKTKRPEMAQIAYEKSDLLILTSDNPRYEEPMDILNDMCAGLSGKDESTYLVIEDRHQAIKVAATMAREGDIILIAGKGHEKYQDVKGVKHHFDDVEEVKKYLCK